VYIARRLPDSSNMWLCSAPCMQDHGMACHGVHDVPRLIISLSQAELNRWLHILYSCE
jgi:hypothetical protein